MPPPWPKPPPPNPRAEAGAEARESAPSEAAAASAMALILNLVMSVFPVCGRAGLLDEGSVPDLARSGRAVEHAPACSASAPSRRCLQRVAMIGALTERRRGACGCGAHPCSAG